MFYDQSEFDVRCEWGLAGITHMAASDVFVVVDVLSFSTCVDIATANGASIYPYKLRDESAAAYARSLDAVLALTHRAAAGGYSLSPASLATIPAGTRLVLPSPNGATLTLATGQTPTFAGCLRNARAVAEAASAAGKRITVVAAGERWPDGTLRPAFEDLAGAGAIIHHLTGSRSPEAQAAEAVFTRFRDDLQSLVKQCSSGKELVEKGFEEDVRLAAALNVSECAPRLVDGAYVRQRRGDSHD
jgi:2-phosphosulfolactate phosphatase